MPLSSIPLPFKVLLSFLAVLAAGAVPALVYVELGFDDRLLRHQAEATAEQARQMASELAEVERTELRDRLIVAAPFCGCRLSAIQLNGEVFFDSAVPSAGTLPDHRSRPEVQQVIGGVGEARSFHPDLEGVGVARRVSTTTGEELLYVAVRVRAPPNSSSWILRLATRTERALTLQRAASTYLRNAMAVSISMALLLTLLAAFAFVRPLRRLKVTAEALADGDFTASSEALTQDEIGDVANALGRLGTELRRKMAAAGSVEAVALQLVEGMRSPVVLLTEDGAVLAINGPARRMLQMEGPAEAEVVAKLAQRKRIRSAFKAAASSGLPERVEAGLFDDTPVWAHVIRRPADRPLWLLSAGDDNGNGGELPAPEDVVTRPLVEVVDQAVEQLKASLDEHEIEVTLADRGVPRVSVAEAGDRLSDALLHVLGAAIPQVAEGSRKLALRFDVEDTRVGVLVAAVLEEEDQERVEALLTPIGGEVEGELGEVTLWLPRA